MLKDEIETGFIIESIAFKYFASESYSKVANFSVYMGLSELDQLTEIYENNYIQGTRQQVLVVDTLELEGEQGDWVVLELDEAFYYSNEYNLIIETFDPSGYCYTAVYGSPTTLYRSLLSGGCSGSEGDLYAQIPYMMLEGYQSLENTTVGAIKIILGR